MDMNTTTQQVPMGDPTPQSPSTGGSAATPKQTPGTVSDPNKVRDPDTEAPSKVEDPAPVEMPDIAKPDTKPNVGKGGDVTPPKEPAE